MDVNVQGTVRVLECARARQGREVRLCGFVVLLRACRDADREDHPIAPQYPYALSKYQGEQAVFHWHQVYGLPVNSICIFNAYGPRVRTTGAYGAVFGVFFRQKLAGKPYTVVGDGTQTRDFIYVTDVATAFLAAAETPIVGERFNVGAGNPQSINRLVELLGGEVVYVPKRPGEPDCTFADIGKIAAISAGGRRSSSGGRRAACSPISSTGATRRYGTRIDRAARPRPGSAISAREAAH